MLSKAVKYMFSVSFISTYIIDFLTYGTKRQRKKPNGGRNDQKSRRELWFSQVQNTNFPKEKKTPEKTGGGGRPSCSRIKLAISEGRQQSYHKEAASALPPPLSYAYVSGNMIVKSSESYTSSQFFRPYMKFVLGLN